MAEIFKPHRKVAPLTYEQFFRKFVIRRYPQMTSPPICKLEEFNFPRNSLHHYGAYDDLSDGPATNDTLYQFIDKRIQVRHYLSYVLPTEELRGNPTLLSADVTRLVREFHTKNPRFRNLLANPIPPDQTLLTVINNALITKRYRYVRTPMSGYWRFINFYKSAFRRANNLVEETNRNQFFFLKCPQRLPSIRSFEEWSLKDPVVGMFRRFGNPELFIILELWKWINPTTRDKSIFAEITQKAYKNVHFVFEDAGNMVILKLDLLFASIKTKDNMQGSVFDPVRVQRSLLFMLMQLMNRRTGESITEEVVDEDGNVTIKTMDPANREDEQQIDDIERTQAEIDREIDEQLKMLEAIEENIIADEASRELDEASREKQFSDEKIHDAIQSFGPVIPKEFDQEATPDSRVREIITSLSASGVMSSGDMRRLTKLADESLNLKAPFQIDGKDVPLLDYINVKKEDLAFEPIQIPDMKGVVDKSMLTDTLSAITKKYNREVLNRHVVGAVYSACRQGVIIENYKIEKNRDVTGSSTIHTVSVQPVQGKRTTWRFEIPDTNDRGEFKTGNNTYFMRPQRVDAPIRKINDRNVALASGYGKTFVMRSERKAVSYNDWLKNALVSRYNNQTDQDLNRITHLQSGNAFDHESDVPRHYSALAMCFINFTLEDKSVNPPVVTEFILDTEAQLKEFGPEAVKALNTSKTHIIAKRGKEIVIVDEFGQVFAIKHGDWTKSEYFDKGDVAPLEQVLGLDGSTAPIEFAEIRIFNEMLPVGLVLGYLYGLDNLIKKLKVGHRRVPVGTRANVMAFEYALVFNDETLVFQRDDKIATMILAGFNAFAKSIRNYSASAFNRRVIYLHVLDSKKLSNRFLRGITDMDTLFVDNITRDYLIKMNEPTTFRGLLVRSCELLTNDYYPTLNDFRWQRMRGNERFASAVYAEIVGAVREHGAKINRNRSPIDLHPHAVWMRITDDPAVKISEDLNPIHMIKESETLTFGGVGGRSTRSMTRPTRAAGKYDMGIVSEGTVDSSDTGIITYMSANPNIKSLSGDVEILPDTPEARNGAKMLSTSAVLSVSSDQDDAKRTNFINIQQSHGIACDGYHAASLSTGYEKIIAHRAGPKYARIAKGPGKILEADSESITVLYADKTEEKISLMRRFGSAGGLTVPHDMGTQWKTGDVIKQGDVIAFNKGWFEPDFFEKGSVNWKGGKLIRMALIEGKQTHEDACAISQEAANFFVTHITKIKDVMLTFDQTITGLVKIGDKTAYDTILCMIQDATTADTGLFNEQSLATLAERSAQAPIAKETGRVDEIEVFYNGDKSEMSESLRKIANEADKALAKRMILNGEEPLTGKAGASFRSDGESLQKNQMCIRIKINVDVPLGTGDKLVVANQMKTIVSKVEDAPTHTLSGLKVDMKFGAVSVMNRIVLNPVHQGMTNVLLGLLTKEALNLYFKESK